MISAEDWAREQETLFVLQNTDLMQQIARSAESHAKGKGYRPSAEELDEITSMFMPLADITPNEGAFAIVN